MGRSVGSFLIGRFMGQDVEEAYVPLETLADRPVLPPPPPKWHTAFAVLKYKSLYLYTAEDCVECTNVLAVSSLDVNLYPTASTDLDAYLRTNPIRLVANDGAKHPLEAPIYMYFPSNSDKEDWYIKLCRARKLPINADDGACSVYFNDTPPIRAYKGAMEKLIDTIGPDHQDSATAWLNALVGRAFVGIHSNPALKAWLLEKISRRSQLFHRDEDGPSILGDIVVRDIAVGDSIPVLSNPKLLEISLDGDMMVEMDIEYTGGVRIDAATLATISINSLELKPLQVPIVVGVQINRFSARILIKVKGMWETNRFWVGIQREPEVKLEMKVEPVLGHKLISMGLVNQVIERRIKEVLEEFFVVPSMEDIGFWATDGLGGMFWDDHANDSDVEDHRDRDYEDDDDRDFYVSSDESSSEDDKEERRSVAEASRRGEAVESTLRPKLRKRRTFEKLLSKSRENLSDAPSVVSPFSALSAIRDADRRTAVAEAQRLDQERIEVERVAKALSDQTLAHKQTSTTTEMGSPANAVVPPPWYYETLGTAADYLGRTSRYYGVDDTVTSLTKTAASYALPVVETATERAGGLKNVVGGVWETVGGWIGGGFEAPTVPSITTTDIDAPSPASSTPSQIVTSASSEGVDAVNVQAERAARAAPAAAVISKLASTTLLDMMGLSISTRNPSTNLSTITRATPRVPIRRMRRVKSFSAPSTSVSQLPLVQDISFMPPTAPTPTPSPLPPEFAARPESLAKYCAPWTARTSPVVRSSSMPQGLLDLPVAQPVLPLPTLHRRSSEPSFTRARDRRPTIFWDADSDLSDDAT
ncbi:hypothetical protein HKX48_000358 [Thoreauomyces humboldtii]|nr:hypothetical protein HKX48_000358 [Thoreauomyces humboldtii]